MTKSLDYSSQKLFPYAPYLANLKHEIQTSISGLLLVLLAYPRHYTLGLNS